MSNLLTAGVAALLTSLKASGGVTVTYTQGATSGTLTAVATQDRLRISDGAGGSFLLHTDASFLVGVADLEAVGVDEPAEGDRVTHNGDTYEVMPLPGGEPPWRYTDATRVIWRIHTRRVTRG